MEKVESYWQKYCQAKERAEQAAFPIILMFDHIICDEYEDLKKNFSEDNKELFIKNINFMLTKIS